METIKVKGELLFELTSKQDWVDNVQKRMPDKTRGAETWLWVDKNGNVFENGGDFEMAEKTNSYPCRVYRLCCVKLANK